MLLILRLRTLVKHALCLYITTRSVKREIKGTNDSGLALTLGIEINLWPKLAIFSTAQLYLLQKRQKMSQKVDLQTKKSLNQKNTPSLSPLSNKNLLVTPLILTLENLDTKSVAASQHPWHL